MGNIVLNGVDIELLEKQRNAVRKDASAYIANGIKEVKELVNQIKDADEDFDIASAAETAEQILTNIQRVSAVSGVEYDLPHSDGYGNVYGDEPLTRVLDEAADGIYDGPLSGLYGKLEDMEYTVRQWNASNC